MSGDRLTALQWRILRVLAPLKPPWTLTGGAALAGIYLKHRVTKDLDLFWHQLQQLEELPAAIHQSLLAAGLEAVFLQKSATFCRLRVREGSEVCLVDLVAEPSPALHAPQEIAHQGISISVDSPQEILVNKLCALLGRSEVRDLIDVQGLLAAGADLDEALATAPRKDGGFSPLTLAWVLKGFQLKALARTTELSDEDLEALEGFKENLIWELLAASRPG